MLILMRHGSPREEAERVLDLARRLDLDGRIFAHGETLVVSVAAAAGRPDRSLFDRLPGVERVVEMSDSVPLVARRGRARESVVAVGSARIGGGELTVIAGPCAVESEEQIVETARRVKACGADLLRGGAFKPRTSPYSFQGLEEPGLAMLAAARDETGLPLVTEAVDEAGLDLVERYADMVQVGARNMQNFALLKRVGRGTLPVLLKRGMSATLQDLLFAAEYILNEGNERVVLCERGIRTFADHTRYTLDLSVVPAVRERSHLPILVDPSHATGRRSFIGPMARAAVAAGADGVMIEVHPDPERALCDGRQALVPNAFAPLIADLRALRHHLGQRTETVP